MSTSQEQRLRILTAFGAREGSEPTAAGMCSACADLLGVAGVGLLVMTGGGTPGATYASSPLAATLEELQLTLGIGPRVDAYARGIPVIEPDLERAADRWIGFGRLAVEAGAGAVGSFPLRIGGARLGTLTVYGAGRGPLDDETYALALIMAEVVTGALLAAQAGMAEGALAAGLGDPGALDARVHQASGMVSVQLGVGVGEALGRLRARAFADGTPLGTLATDVIARRLRFDER